MRRKLFRPMALGLLLSLVAAAVASAQAPQTPEAFYGVVRLVKGTPPVERDAPQGLIVSAATQDGIVRGQLSVSPDGMYGGSLGTDPKLLVQDTADPGGSSIPGGATIQFFVNGCPAQQTATFRSGAVTSLDLRALDDAPPTFLNVQSLVNLAASSAAITFGTSEAATAELKFGVSAAEADFNRPSIGARIASVPSDAPAGPNRFRAELGGLEANRDFFFRLRGVDQVGCRAVSGLFAFSTVVAVSPSPVPVTPAPVTPAPPPPPIVLLPTATPVATPVTTPTPAVTPTPAPTPTPLAQTLISTNIAINRVVAKATDVLGRELTFTGDSVSITTVQGIIRVSIPINLAVGVNLRDFTDPTGISVSGNQVTIPLRDATGEVTARLELQIARVLGTGNEAVVEVSRAVLATVPRSVDFTQVSAEVGRAEVEVRALLAAIPDRASVQVAISKIPPPLVLDAFQILARSAATELRDVAYSVRIDKVNLQDVRDVTSSTVNLKVGVDWENRFGRENVVVLRVADDGRREILTTRRVGPGVFEAEARGLSEFGLVAFAAPPPAATPVPTPTLTPTLTPTPVATPAAVVTPTPTATPTPRVVVTVVPTAPPTLTVSPGPTRIVPTVLPTPAVPPTPTVPVLLPTPTATPALVAKVGPSILVIVIPIVLVVLIAAGVVAYLLLRRRRRP